ncbi:transmembrane 7 superfamily member 3-like [Hyposmocoma kahamanoa]|uniref:transmembrane 7 superfamily member 3-like n=1 Tax=Hyposmocoma kahamanoa TaxID=1477025 RepID=UPI000E6D85D5|nr:transmembrane 7 superfamily member 3-like [Hyposmocoma kahamanoa]XP_026318098.1 transmembrane 7 superfamily member 3-like [Hyposmocoma kahamanoa]XP_026318099.1 transmembrane 7 superfamily member 3-like [Hyposmocoma kahamanoa]XP_026318100.1 transmembrane 7 superfamily member 3-like [Hyposmocoma kahamanoa]XP_026318101.1 transmembrane 7 superfamily member 3-like [Hyposmocoma kahamanoa]
MEMFIRSQCNKYVFVFVFFVISVVKCENANITIPLNKTITQDNRELFGGFVTIKSNSTLQVNLQDDFDKKVVFIIFQVHSHIYNVTLYNNTGGINTLGSHIYGTNLGLYCPVKPALDTYYINNMNTKDLKLYVTVHGYRKIDPIPGGCNLDLPIYVSPFMILSYDKALINIGAPPPQDVKINPNCNMVEGNTGTTISFYKMFLPEKALDENTYFDGLRKMLTLDHIKENAVEIPEQHLPKRPIARIRRSLSSYLGTGTVYVAVAYKISNPKMYSVYVPTYTYACSPLEGNCNILDDIVSEIFCATLIFIGLFTCFFGHRFFKTEMFLVGMFTGVIITYILISIISSHISESALLGASLLSGVFFGAIWLLFWWFYGIPVMSVFLCTLHLGFMLSSIIYFGMPPGHLIFEQNSTFWTIFVVVMLFTSITLITMTFLSNIFCCAVLGAYATVFALDHYIGSNLKYITINTLRRAVVDDFNYADLSPPYQWRDVMSTLFWVALAISGFLFQHYHNRGRSPFPPPPRSITPLNPDSHIYNNYGSVTGRTRRLFTIERGTDVAEERAPLISENIPRNTL